MTIQPADLFQMITAETIATSRAVQAAAQLNDQRAERISKLVKRQTDAFIDLSQHYLPNLTSKSLTGAWQEVREEIRDILLLKDDQRRALIARRDQNQTRRQALQLELHHLHEQLAKAKVVLGCKTGNFKKTLREDPMINQCADSIAQLDEDIDCCLAQLDAVEGDAIAKLPDYEACSLFQYLRTQRFGTPQYQARGLERRWDRWVARLIHFDRAQSSFEYLTEAPAQLKSLIEEKQDRYRRLLHELEQARADALTRFDVPGQTEAWRQLNQQVETLEAEIDRVQWQESCLTDQVYDIENINGQYYDRAIDVYRRFLMKLDAEMLRVYAACTESPEDDEICARIRHSQADIKAERDWAADRQQQIVDLEKYVSALHELAGRLRMHLRQTPENRLIRGDFHFGELLRHLRQGRRTPGEVWRTLRQAMTHGDVTALPPHGGLRVSGLRVSGRQEPTGRSWTSRPLRPLEASFLAAAERSIGGLPTGSRQVDPTGIVVMPPLQFADQQVADQRGFSTLAICGSQTEANYVAALLMTHTIDSFVHTQVSPVTFDDAPRDDEIEIADEVHVMVPTRLLRQSRELIVEHQQQLETAWRCQSCDSLVDAGYGLCWRCGRQRGA